MLHPCEEMDRTLEVMSRICLENDVVISWQFVSSDRFNRQDSPFLLNVKRDGVVL